MRLAAGVEAALDLPVGDVILAVDAVDVDGEQRADAVAGVPGDFGGCGAGVQPQGQGGVAQVVRAPGEWRGRCGPESQDAGGVPGAAVAAFAERATAGHQPGAAIEIEAEAEIWCLPREREEAGFTGLPQLNTASFLARSPGSRATT
jgi:hypothetical protein